MQLCVLVYVYSYVLCLCVCEQLCKTCFKFELEREPPAQAGIVNVLSVAK